MKKYFMNTLTALALALVCFVAASIASYAAETPSVAASLAFETAADNSDGKIYMQQGRDNKTYLFLPASADFSALTFSYDDSVFSAVSFSANGVQVAVENGVPVSLAALCSDAQEHPMKLTAVTAAGTQTVDVVLMKSENIRAMYLVSADPVNYGMDYVHAAKSNGEAKGSVLIVTADGETEYAGELSQIKGRGNSTFTSFDKKPYQIKLNKKAELVDGAGKSKKWVLLANAADPSMIRNALTFDAGQMLGLEYTSCYEFVDLYYDGEYRGCYMLTEKVETGEGRVEIDKTDDLIEDANPNYDFDNPVIKTATVASKGEVAAQGDVAGSYRYVDGVAEPAFPEGASHHAFLLEFDTPSRYADELTGFVTNKGQGVVTKSPEYLTKDQGAYIAALWQEFEDAVYSPNGYNKNTGKYYYDYVDFDSLVKCYVVNEVSKNYDYYKTSTFFYLAADSDKMMCGPLWDYDIAYGLYLHEENKNFASSRYFFNITSYLGDGLIKIESFRNAVQKMTASDGEMTAIVRTFTKDGGNIDVLSQQIRASASMNCKLWDITNANISYFKVPADTTFDSAVAELRTYLNARYDWLCGEISKWNGDSYELITGPETPKNDNPLLSFLQDILNIFRAIINWFKSLFA